MMITLVRKSLKHLCFLAFKFIYVLFWVTKYHLRIFTQFPIVNFIVAIVLSIGIVHKFRPLFYRLFFDPLRSCLTMFSLSYNTYVPSREDLHNIVVHYVSKCTLGTNYLELFFCFLCFFHVLHI